MQGIPPSEERKLSSVLFADLVGSTALASEADPERTRLMLERFYDAMSEEITTFGGTVEKFAGDAVMAAFGAPAAQEDHAERALHAALAMRTRLEALFEGRLQLRIGVNTGEVVVGRAREGSSFLTGDPVNVAARLEQAADPGEILAGERTVAAAGAAFEFAEPTHVEAKGKPGGVACRRVVRALSVMRPRGVGALRSAFVGRDSDLETLRAAYRGVARESRPHLVTILGEAGAGKTRLARELWDWLAEQDPRPHRHTGHCLPYGQGITYWPLGEIIKDHFGMLEGDPASTCLLKLGRRQILALALGLDVARELHPRAARDRFRDSWIEFLRELSTDSPAVLLVEDLHWAEDDLLDLLERLLRGVEGALLMLCTARPELLARRPGWGGARWAATTVELDPLSAEEERQMLAAVLGTDPPERLRSFTRQAEGNPFFVEELLSGLIDRGSVAHTEEGWEVGELPEHTGTPDTVQSVVAARIDLLGPDEKAALQAGSVIGRVFWAGPIYELLPDADPDFDQLEDRDFLRRCRESSIAGENELIFKHQLTRDVAYASLPKARRARLHAGFAAWLERFGGGGDEYASLLAHHYAEAVRPEDVDLVWAGAEDDCARLRERAVSWLSRAGELSLGRYEVGEARVLLERAAVLEGDPKARIVLLQRLARAHILSYHPERFRSALEQALALDPEPDQAAAIFAELALYGRGRSYMWREPPPRELGERWLETALELAGPHTKARGYALVARALSRPEAGAAAAAEALAVAEELRDPRLGIYASEAHVLVASAAGRFGEACDWSDRALTAAAALDDPDIRVAQLWLAAFAYLRAGRLPVLRPVAAEYDRKAAPLSTHHEVHAIALHALLATTTCDWSALAALVPRALAGAEANADTPCQFNWRSLIVCALGLEHAGEGAEARRLEEQAREAAVVAGPPEREPALLRLAVARGELEEAERILAHLPASGDPWEVDAAAARLDALVALGDTTRVEEEAAPFLVAESYTHPFALRALGRVRGDRALMERAAALFEANGAPWQAERTRSPLAQEGVPPGGVDPVLDRTEAEVLHRTQRPPSDA